jgi:hypothetical protein
MYEIYGVADKLVKQYMIHTIFGCVLGKNERVYNL